MANDNVTLVTVTPPKGAVTQSALSHRSKGMTTGPGLDQPSILCKKKLPRLDARLDPIHQLTESQPSSAIQVTLSKIAITLLLATQTL
jgi:hypothetical protein